MSQQQPGGSSPSASQQVASLPLASQAPSRAPAASTSAVTNPRGSSQHGSEASQPSQGPPGQLPYGSEPLTDSTPAATTSWASNSSSSQQQQQYPATGSPSQHWPSQESQQPGLGPQQQQQQHGPVRLPQGQQRPGGHTKQPSYANAPSPNMPHHSPIPPNFPRKRELSAFQQPQGYLPTAPSTPQQQHQQHSMQPPPPATPAVQQDGVSASSHWAAAGGIDLRAEEEALRANDPLAAGSSAGLAPLSTANTAAVSMQRSAGQGHTPYLQLYPLAQMVYRTASQHGLGDVEPEVLNTLSSAARIRFRNLLEAMVKSTRHRCWSTHLREPPMHVRDDDDDDDDAGSNDNDNEAGSSRSCKAKTNKPMYREELLSDPSKWLTAIERADRGQEAVMRRRRAHLRELRERAAAAAAAGTPLPGGLNGLGGSDANGFPQGDDAGMEADENGQPRKRPRKDASASMTARNMSEDVRRRLANNTAARALGGIGGTMPKWMMMGGGSAANTPVKPFSTPKKEDGGGDGEGDQNSAGPSSLPKPRFAPGGNGNGGSSGGWGRTSSISGLAPSGLSDSPLPGGAADADGVPPGVNPQGWGDPALRALAKEEEERKRRQRVNLDDALQALETERRANQGGRGSGQKTLYRWRMLRSATSISGVPMGPAPPSNSGARR